MQVKKIVADVLRTQYSNKRVTSRKLYAAVVAICAQKNIVEPDRADQLTYSAQKHNGLLLKETMGSLKKVLSEEMSFQSTFSKAPVPPAACPGQPLDHQVYPYCCLLSSFGLFQFLVLSLFCKAPTPTAIPTTAHSNVRLSIPCVSVCRS